jgi:hypothetical protein
MIRVASVGQALQRERHMSLIAAALRGVETARKRVEALEDVRDVLTTYDPFGKMTLTSKAQKTVEKKA